MTLSSTELENLIDVVENKLSTMMIHDCADMREAKMLKNCVDKLKSMKSSAEAIVGEAPEAVAAVSSH